MVPTDQEQEETNRRWGDSSQMGRKTPRSFVDVCGTDDTTPLKFAYLYIAISRIYHTYTGTKRYMIHHMSVDNRTTCKSTP